MKILSCWAAALAFGLAPARASDAVGIRPVLSEALPNIPGQTVTMVRVSFPPGAVSAPHRHAGSVAVYVSAGAIRSKVGDGPSRVYHVGDTFFEPAGALHAVAENASTTAPAEILAVFVAESGAVLTREAK